jgi:hypothetical protein
MRPKTFALDLPLQLRPKRAITDNQEMGEETVC